MMVAEDVLVKVTVRANDVVFIDWPPKSTKPGLATSESDAPAQHPHATSEGMRCPGCGRSTLLGLTIVDHTSDCPLRGPSTLSSVPDKSSFPGVPAHEDIGFVPLFGA